MKRLQLFVGMLGLVIAFSAPAKVEVLEFESPAHEERYNKLIAELRCLVCQNQNLADSNAELAVDLRRKTYVGQQGQIRERDRLLYGRALRRF